jgi:hypothetical protein
MKQVGVRGSERVDVLFLGVGFGEGLFEILIVVLMAFGMVIVLLTNFLHKVIIFHIFTSLTTTTIIPNQPHINLLQHIYILLLILLLLLIITLK